MSGMYLGFALVLFLASLTVWMVMVPRRRMQERAKQILREMPHHEEQEIYLRFTSPWPSAKKRAFEAKIAEIEADGWTYLKANEAGFLRTIRSIGGGLNLHFVRKT